MVVNKAILILCAFILALLPKLALADNLSTPWIIRAGVGDIDLSSNLALSVGGQPAPRAALHLNHAYTAVAEVGYSFANEWAIVATVGWPPHIGAYGGGTIASYGKLEGITFGPTALTVQCQPIQWGVVCPYVGLGISYLIVFSTEDTAMQHSRLSNDLAPAFELGFDFATDEKYGLFLETKKALLETHPRGNIGGGAAL
jgi:outer membrane protein